MSTSSTPARVVEHTYWSSGKQFLTVECRACNSILNSGHHYVGANRRHAPVLAQRHNVEVHGHQAVEALDI